MSLNGVFLSLQVRLKVLQKLNRKSLISTHQKNDTTMRLKEELEAQKNYSS